MKLVESKVINLREVHETAIVHPNAKLGRNVVVGPYAIIGENVEIGDNCVIGPHVVIEGWTTIGQGNRFFHGCSIGCEPQDLKFRGEKSYLFIGDNNTFRENVTVSRGTEGGGGETRIGNNNLFMAYSHVAHDCQLGSHIVIANCTALAGHVTVEDRAVIGGMSGIHQFTKIGKMVMVGACSKIVKDVPPFVLVDGNPAKVSGINVVGLRRNGIDPQIRDEIKKAYRILYRSSLTVNRAIEQMEQELQGCEEIDHFIRFLRNAERGILR
ncbi:MAG TPA: acyl-ACP--UDP-N-acetylglucosamine O-acyltransferase [Bacillota bacterium]|jgi:UDP-N-acetylglucosamine acyltransferase|nr:acyl-ACP--UDP-N-acetylglucosamine O-acyltransferase [Bacillota bacterium]HOL10560.1 acyl-ACP--UDP-N-acetylglucosamine O-acyltransferase [Bacillota bacterium]HPO98324.1 acyl-ACP--UDP-N-acetylglucosamine O-acyltransferase [Bacillota bacterium]